MSNWSAKLPLTEETVKRHVGNCGGVLRLICRKDESCVVFYVKSTDDLGSSLLEMVHGAAQNSLLAEHLKQSPIEFRFFPTDNAFERSQVEEVELAKWRPPCNAK
jgi:hypothetical protein